MIAAVTPAMTVAATTQTQTAVPRTAPAAPQPPNPAPVMASAAPQGDAAADPDFTGEGDRIRYSVSVLGAQGPFQVDAELWYQPTGFRWANNLRKYDAPEPKRFVGYWDSMAASSGVLVTKASAAR